MSGKINTSLKIFLIDLLRKKSRSLTMINATIFIKYKIRLLISQLQQHVKCNLYNKNIELQSVIVNSFYLMALRICLKTSRCGKMASAKVTDSLIQNKITVHKHAIGTSLK